MQFSSDAINAEVIRQVENCLFIVCLDDSPQVCMISITSKNPCERFSLSKTTPFPSEFQRYESQREGLFPSNAKRARTIRERREQMVRQDHQCRKFIAFKLGGRRVKLRACRSSVAPTALMAYATSIRCLKESQLSSEELKGTTVKDWERCRRHCTYICRILTEILENIRATEENINVPQVTESNF